MPIQNCQIHQLPQDVICCEGTCLRRYCSQCFMEHNEQHNTGVFLNQLSKQSLIQWNQYLLNKFDEVRNNIKPKGINCIFQMKLNASYPKGLLNEISNTQIADVAIKIIGQYLQTLQTNVTFISSRQDINQLDIPELLKDIFIFFVYQSGKGLCFLNQKMQNELKLKYPQKKMYEYVDFAFVPKELRQIQVKRKAIIKNVQSQTLIQRKKVGSPIANRHLERERVTSPRIVRSGVVSPRKTLLLSNSGVKIANQTQNTSSAKVNSPEVKTVVSPQKQQIKTQPITSSSIENGNKIEQQQKVVVNFEKQPQFTNITQYTQQPTVTLIQKQVQIPIQQQNPIQQVIQDKHQPTSQPQQQQQQQQQKPLINQAVGIQRARQFFSRYANGTTNNQTIKQPTQQNQNQKQIKILKQQLSQLQQKIKQKQRTIRSLNSLINNQQQQIHYRQNQVQILTQQIKKLLIFKQKSQQLSTELQKTKQQLKFKQKSITQLNNLIGNEEQQLQFRENQVQTLTIQIKKLIEWKTRCEQIQQKLNEKQLQLNQRQRGIKQLNNVIGNQEEQLAFRQSQVQTLTTQLKKVTSSKIQHQQKIQQLQQDKQLLIKQNKQLQLALKQLQKQKMQPVPASNNQTNYDEQLMEQVIDLESQVVARNQDIKELVNVVNNLQKYIPNDQLGQILTLFKSLQTVKLTM